MNLSCGLRSNCAVADSPRAHLVRACRKECKKSQQLERRLYETVKAGFLKTDGLKIFLCFLLVKLRNLRLYTGRNGDDLGIFLCRVFLHALNEFVIVLCRCRLVFSHIRHVKRRLQRQKVHIVGKRKLVLRELRLTYRLAVVEACLDFLEHLNLCLCLLAAAL